MSSVNIAPAQRISCVKSGVTCIIDDSGLIEKEGMRFFHCTSANESLRKWGKGSKGFKQLRVLHREAFEEQFRIAREASGELCDYKRMRYTTRTCRRLLLDLPDIMEVELPSHGGVQGVKIKMLCTKPSAELWVAFSVEVFKFLLLVDDERTPSSPHPATPARSTPPTTPSSDSKRSLQSSTERESDQQL